MSIRTAREVVELYNFTVWNERDLALAPELFADNVVRHGVGSSVTLTRDEAVRRIRDALDGVDRMTFTLPVIVAGDDAEHVAIVYQCEATAHDGALTQISSIEVFHVVGGQITEVYNNSYQVGLWQ